MGTNWLFWANGFFLLALVPLAATIWGFKRKRRGIKIMGGLLFLAGILAGLVFLFFHFATGMVVSACMGKVKSDMRTIRVALESYAVDWNGYPDSLLRLIQVKEINLVDGKMVEGGTYLASIPTFMADDKQQLPSYLPFRRSGSENHSAWILWTAGMDYINDLHTGPELDRALAEIDQGRGPNAWLLNHAYDPTNGALSAGDVVFWRQ